MSSGAPLTPMVDIILRTKHSQVEASWQEKTALYITLFMYGNPDTSQLPDNIKMQAAKNQASGTYTRPNPF